jgi:hypothetical protein
MTPSSDFFPPRDDDDLILEDWMEADDQAAPADSSEG